MFVSSIDPIIRSRAATQRALNRLHHDDWMREPVAVIDGATRPSYTISALIPSACSAVTRRGAMVTSSGSPARRRLETASHICLSCGVSGQTVADGHCTKTQACSARAANWR